MPRHAKWHNNFIRSTFLTQVIIYQRNSQFSEKPALSEGYNPWNWELGKENEIWYAESACLDMLNDKTISFVALS